MKKNLYKNEKDLKPIYVRKEIDYAFEYQILTNNVNKFKRTYTHTLFTINF